MKDYLTAERIDEAKREIRLKHTVTLYFDNKDEMHEVLPLSRTETTIMAALNKARLECKE